MKKIFVAALAALFLATPSQLNAKKADLAGEWYTSNGTQLKKELEGYINAAKVPPLKGQPVAFIVPHAGYRFSGPVAGYAYKAIAEKGPETVVVVGFSHRLSFRDIAVLNDRTFDTPLGEAQINAGITAKLMAADPAIKDQPRVFAGENSIEMQVPFIQAASPGAKVVLLIIGEQTRANIKIVSDALYAALKDEKDYVMIGSTDMSHYLAYRTATAKDMDTIEAIKNFDAEALYRKSSGNRHDILCGFGSSCAVMEAAKKLGADSVEVLKYANSGDTAGVTANGVVGYVSAVFIKGPTGVNPGERTQENNGGEMKKNGDPLNKDERAALLSIARDTINMYLATGKTYEPKVDAPSLRRDMGAFVTLHERGELRGCIGHMTAEGPLYLAVRDMAIAAATQDPRFPRVSPGEMKEIDIEISALSPMRKITDWREIEVGRHGVMVKMGLKGGVYLPQVATETGWDREAFMNSLCAHKAGIPIDAWKTGRCEMYIFTAEVFGEKNK